MEEAKSFIKEQSSVAILKSLYGALPRNCSFIKTSQLKSLCGSILNYKCVKIEFIDLPLHINSVHEHEKVILKFGLENLLFLSFFDHNIQLLQLICRYLKVEYEGYKICLLELKKLNTVLRNTAYERKENEVKPIDPIQLDFPSLFKAMYISEETVKNMMKIEDVNTLKVEQNAILKTQQLVNETTNAIHKEKANKMIQKQRLITNSKVDTWQTQKKEKHIANKKLQIQKQQINDILKCRALVVHKERTSYRKNKLEDKELKILTNKLEKQMEHQLRQESLQRLVDSVKIEAITDPDRVKQPTYSWNSKSKKVNEKKEKYLQTYTNEQLFKDPKFNLLYSIHQYGLTQSKYAGSLLKEMDSK